MEITQPLKGNKELLHFNKDKGSLLLSIPKESVSADGLKEMVEEKRLSQKEEFHLTIIGTDTGTAILEKIATLSPEEQENILSRIEKLGKSFDWEYTFLPEYYFISKNYEKEGEPRETRQSIIQVVAMPDLVSFYKKLNDLLETDFETPFPHVTLFTRSTEEKMNLRGIGIYSVKQFESLCPIRLESKDNSEEKGERPYTEL